MKKAIYNPNIVGLEEVFEAINQIVIKKDLYSKLHIPVPTLIIALDNGEGRSLCTQEITRLLRSNRIIENNGGLDEYIELKFDGSYSNLERMKRLVNNAAVYANVYRGVISVEPIELVKVYGESVYKDFIHEYSTWTKNTCTVVYVPREPSTAQSKMIRELIDAGNNSMLVKPKEYTLTHLADICIEMIRSYDIAIKRNQVIGAIESYIKKEELNSVAQMEILSRRITLQYTKPIPKPSKGIIEIDCKKMREELLGSKPVKRGSKNEQRR